MHTDRNIVPIGRLVTQPHLLKVLDALATSTPSFCLELAKQIEFAQQPPQPVLRLVRPPEQSCHQTHRQPPA